MNQDFSRKMVYIGILASPILFLIVCLVLIFSTGTTMENYQVPLTVLTSSVIICELLSILYVFKRWNVEEGTSPEEISKKLVKDIIRLAIYQVVAIFGLVYFMLAYVG
jgi:uncharacterized membrane protein